MTDYTARPVCSLFPLMTDQELAGLTKDIEEDGLIEDIVLYEGMVLDGRNRLEACKRAGVNPRFVDWDDGSPTLYVLSKNLHWRHLSTSQRAAIAAEAMSRLQEEARKRQIESLKQGPVSAVRRGRDSANGVNDLHGKASEIAAKAVSVGARTVERAVAVKRADAEEFERIRRGEVTVQRAERNVAKRAGGMTTRRLQVQNKAKRRMEEILSHMRAPAQGLARVNPEVVTTQCTAEETEVWASTALTVAKTLRDFAGKLRRTK